MANKAIIDAARAAREKHSKVLCRDVSDATKAAQAICREWQEAVKSPTVLVEYPVTQDLKEKFDVFEAPVAYELKVSQNNPSHEFYKDLFKVIAFNETHEERIIEFVFLSCPRAIDSLNRGLGHFAAMWAKKYGVSVKFVAL